MFRKISKKHSYIHQGAKLDATGKYRYLLERAWSWDKAFPSIAFIGLNPSTADADVDDPTIRKCVTLSKNLGFGSLYMLNLFAFRATKPEDMFAADDPIGKWNDEWIRIVTKECEKVIVCWGNYGATNQRDLEVLRLLEENNTEYYAFGINKNGTPKHPLYLKNDSVFLKVKMDILEVV